MAYEKKPCEICGKEISTFPAAQANHMKKHAAQATAATTTAAPAATPVAKPEVKAAAPELEDQIKRALEAQAKFKQAPDIFIAEQTSDEMLELRKRYCPESIGIETPDELANRKARGENVHLATKHVFFGPYKDLDILVGKGYVPVLDENGRPVRFNETVMTWIPQMMHLAKVYNEQQESRRRLKNSMLIKATEARSTAATDRALPTPTTDGIKIEQMEYKEGDSG